LGEELMYRYAQDKEGGVFSRKILTICYIVKGKGNGISIKKGEPYSVLTGCGIRYMCYIEKKKGFARVGKRRRWVGSSPSSGTKAAPVSRRDAA